MCGIIGIIGSQDLTSSLVGGLKRLEYRGYDSAGLATISNGKIERRRAKGKIKNLEKCLEKQPIFGSTGIGHTRWATHGVPSEQNAHPHATKNVAIVHNGIIENFLSLQSGLLKRGCRLASDTDTELIAHLIQENLDKNISPENAIPMVLSQLEGAFSLGIIFSHKEDLMIAARRGSPLSLAVHKGSSKQAWREARRESLDSRTGAGQGPQTFGTV